MDRYSRHQLIRELWRASSASAATGGCSRVAKLGAHERSFPVTHSPVHQCQRGCDRHSFTILPVTFRGVNPHVPDWPPVPDRLAVDFKIAAFNPTGEGTGYCPGAGELPSSLRVHGWWEPFSTLLMLDILHGQRAPSVFDFGANAGWFTFAAVAAGAAVLAFEGDSDELAALDAGIAANRFNDRVSVRPLWIDARTPPSLPVGTIRFVKIDIEGAEPHAIRMLEPSLTDRLIDYLLVEITPSFGVGQELVDQVCSFGYTAHTMPDKGYDPVLFAHSPLHCTLAEPCTVGTEQSMVLFARSAD